MLNRSFALVLTLALAACGGPDAAEQPGAASDALERPSTQTEPRSPEAPEASDAGAVNGAASEPTADTGDEAADAPASAPTRTADRVPASNGGSSGPAGDAPQRDARAILARAERRHEGIRSIEADFTQVVTVPLLNQTQRSRGKMYHRSPDRFLMRFTDPEGDIVVADGRYLWMYYPSVDERQVMRAPLAQGGGSVDLYREFLSNTTERFDVEHVREERVGGRMTDLLELKPRQPAPYTRVRIWVDRDDSMVRRFEIHEENESVRLLELSNVRPNVTLGDELFRFSPPPGAQVFDA